VAIISVHFPPSLRWNNDHKDRPREEEERSRRRTFLQKGPIAKVILRESLIYLCEKKVRSDSISPESKDQSFESFHTPPSSPRADGGNMSDVFVTPPPSPGLATAGTTAAATGLSSGLRTSTPPCATLRTPSTMRPLLSDAGLDLDFLQINCGKRISAMALIETNVKNKIALIQEPYTSINGCTLIHKRDFFSSCSAPLSPTQGGAAPTTSWTSLRPRASIYAPGRSDVLPVYRFMTPDIATVAVPLGFISSIYMDITKNVRSKELLALLDFCRNRK
jgi:hypothetical protein